MDEIKYVTYLRKGKPVEVDRQVYLWRKRRRIKAERAEAKRAVIQAIVAYHGGDISAARDWIENHTISRYQGEHPMKLLKHRKYKGIYRELKELNNAV